MTFTRVERILHDGGFGQGVVEGLHGHYPHLLRKARDVQAELRQRVGYAGSAPVLTTGATQSKLGKNKLPSFGLMLTPERGFMSPALADIRKAFELTGAFNLCPMASKGCAAACLSRSGQSGMPHQQRAQAVRTAFMLAEPRLCGMLIGAELRKALRSSPQVNLRLNTTSDIRFELIAPDMIRALTDAGVQLYDYTAWSPADREASEDYSLTYSAKEPSHTPDEYLRGILSDGGTVAMPFTTGRGKALPETWQGFTVIDGDKSDERRNDPAGVVVGLRAKGHEWKRDNTAGFIRQAN